MSLLLNAFAPVRLALGEPTATGVEISKFGPETVIAGEQMTYTLCITNASGSTAQGLIVTDTWTFQDYDGNYTTGGDVVVNNFTIVTDVVRFAQFELAPMAPMRTGLSNSPWKSRQHFIRVTTATQLSWVIVS